MPVQVSYPGVYIEELPSGVHTIPGAPTSITAFIGRAPVGPIDRPVTISSFGDFQHFFGGLARGYPLSDAVEDFFNNGGGQAVIVRLFEPNGKKDSGVAAVTVDKAGGKSIPAEQTLKLVGASPGRWGNNLRVSVDYRGINRAVAQNFAVYGLTETDLFNLTISITLPDGQAARETFNALSIRGDKAPNRLDRVLVHQSRLVRVAGDDKGKASLPTKRPPDSATGQGDGGNDGLLLKPKTYIGDEDKKTGLHLLDQTPNFNLMCIPPDTRGGDTDAAVYRAAAEYCRKRRAFLIVDPPARWAKLAKTGRISEIDPSDPQIGIRDDDARNAAVYFPRVFKEDALNKYQPDIFPACGIIAGIFAATDVSRGVWKAPAGTEAALAGIQKLEIELTDADNGMLNPLGINCLRQFPTIGPVVWGARTLRGADALADEYKYVNVRRLTLYLEQSIDDGTRWAVFEPNNESLWVSLRRSIGDFMAELSRQGAFYAYSVTCDATTTTASDIAQGVVNVLVAFAPVRPAEFIVLRFQLPAAAPSA